jgi:phage N-6-adenine-methyltransferase
MVDKALFSSARQDWETPPELFAVLNEEFGFTLDVCATAANAKCERFLSPEEDALTQPWDGVCWMNPPCGRTIGQWMAKAHREAMGCYQLVVCLVPARTDTAWWHDYASEGIVRFLRGRVKFVGAQHGAPFPSALVIFDGRGTASRSRISGWRHRKAKGK